VELAVVTKAVCRQPGERHACGHGQQTGTAQPGPSRTTPPPTIVRCIPNLFARHPTQEDVIGAFVSGLYGGRTFASAKSPEASSERLTIMTEHSEAVPTAAGRGGSRHRAEVRSLHRALVAQDHRGVEWLAVQARQGERRVRLAPA
jgi:hypothetical protein